MQSKYHHLIPKTYLSSWANSSGTVKIQWNDSKKTEPRNIDSIAGINHYHSIMAGMPLCTKEDSDIFFQPLSGYNIFYGNRLLADTLEMNKYYSVFNEWNITRSDGTLVSKKALKAQIGQIKIQDVENLWSQKYESKWNTVRQMIENKVATGVANVPKFYFGYLMKFFVALDWRSLASNKEFSDAFKTLCSNIIQLDKVEIPKDERDLPMFETAADYMRHCLLLQYFRQFLNDTGTLYNIAKMYMRSTSFHFLVSNGNTKFITSDNPCFVNEKTNGTKIGILPITPEILLTQGKNPSNDDNYYITRIADREVKQYNKVIQEHSEQFVAIDNG